MANPYEPPNKKLDAQETFINWKFNRIMLALAFALMASSIACYLRLRPVLLSGEPIFEWRALVRCIVVADMGVLLSGVFGKVSEKDCSLTMRIRRIQIVWKWLGWWIAGSLLCLYLPVKGLQDIGGWCYIASFGGALLALPWVATNGVLLVCELRRSHPLYWEALFCILGGIAVIYHGCCWAVFLTVPLFR